MEPTDAVRARLDRIGALDRSGAAPAELLAELRGLLHEAEAGTLEDAQTRHGTASATTEETEEVVGRLRAALARDIIG